MLKLNDEAAIKQAIHLAEAVCANPNYQAVPNADTANDLADFIRTLEARLQGCDSRSKAE